MTEGNYAYSSKSLEPMSNTVKEGHRLSKSQPGK